MLKTWKDLTIGDMAWWIIYAVMIFGGIVIFIPLYKEIKRKEDTESFFLYVYLALLIANILRILFWSGKNIEFPLPLQSILKIATMFFRIIVCINIKNKHQMKNRVFTGTVIMYLLADVLVFVELLGFFALFTEAVLGLSQFIRNFHNKSTKEMSIAMVLMWTLGDTFKICCFIQ